MVGRKDPFDRMTFRAPQGTTPLDTPVAAPPTLPSGAARFGGYFRPEDIAADRWVHLTALILCVAGVPALLDMAGHAPDPAVLPACAVYAATLVCLFACSTAFYHVPLRIERRRLRQFDHAAIYLLIAGTCTPFTTTLLPGAFAVAITSLVWLGAMSGAIYKLRRPLGFPGFSTAGYLFITGTVVAGLVPVLRSADPASSVLIVGGLAIYALGAGIRTRRSVRYRNTIWHTMVIAAAGCHYAAILHGVVLVPGALR
jgi:hemolysin III